MSEPSQADIFAALQAQSSGSFRRSPPATSPYSTFSQDPKGELATGEEGKACTNSRRLYCFREGCGSVILSEGVGEWLELEGAALPNDPASPFPETPSNVYWHIPGAPFAFDNIGFSRPDVSNPNPLPSFAPRDVEGQGKVKWLICAECDLGPVGWSWEGGKSAWVAADRVRYGPKK
ncbi:hypothetical protein IAU60_000036 [Kwoniella sp. DSM 27419]